MTQDNQVQMDDVKQRITFLDDQVLKSISHAKSNWSNLVSIGVMVFGAVIMTVSILLKHQIIGPKQSNLVASEFITVTLTSLVIIILGAYIGFDSSRNLTKTIREQRRVGAEMLKKGMDIVQAQSKQR